uniref:Uncharacterized protein n=1 Tax=Anguilla anguilla TaxID=7936 RepID=A0A0E9W0L9_ANGAN
MDIWLPVYSLTFTSLILHNRCISPVSPVPLRDVKRFHV